MVTHSSIHCSKTPSVCWTYSPEASESKLLVAIFHLGEGQSTKRNLLSEKTLTVGVCKNTPPGRIASSGLPSYGIVCICTCIYLSIYFFFLCTCICNAYIYIYCTISIYILYIYYIYILYVIYSYCECPRIHRPLRQVARKG